MRRHLAATATSLLLALLLGSCQAEPLDPGGGDPGPGPDPSPATARWSDPATWPDGRVPEAGAAVVVPGGKAVVLDVSPPALASLMVEGTLSFEDRDLQLTAGWIVVNGVFRVGTESRPFTKKAVITLTGTAAGGDIGGMGNRVLGVNGGGTLDLHGERRVSWTRLDATAAMGATQLTLERAVDWRAGDRIVLASTDFDPLRAELVTVTSVSQRSVGIDRPLAYQHYGQRQSYGGRTVDQRGEVGLLTRNIVIQGGDTVGGFGGHIMVHQGGTARVEGVELYQMGQRRLLARYPMHWHMAGPVDGQYFRNSSVWRSFNRCVTVHGTDNALVEDNVCYDHQGHGYFLEDGAESGNTIQGNLGLVSRAPSAAEALLPSDTRAATYWITNPDNVIKNNVAAGSRGFGFWFALPASPTGLSTGQPDLPRRTPLREFSGNVAHSNTRAGLQVDDGPLPDGTTETASYAPRQVPGSSSPAVVAVFQDFVAWKHTGRAVWLRGRDMRLRGAILADNGIGATFASSETFLEDALFVGETANTAQPFSANTPLRGYEFYDGRVGASGVTFVNYTKPGSIPSGALGFLRNNGFSVSTGNYADGLQFVNANPVFLENPNPDRDGDKAAVFLDQTGSVTGTPGAYVAANNPILVTGACAYRSEWNAHVCPHRFVGLNIRSEGAETVGPLTVTRDDGASTRLVGVPNNPRSATLSLIPARGYTIRFEAQVPDSTRLSFSRTAVGEGARITLQYPSANPRVIRDFSSSQTLTAAATLPELEASNGEKYFYDASAGMLHLKAVTQSGRDYANLLVLRQ